MKLQSCFTQLVRILLVTLVHCLVGAAGDDVQESSDNELKDQIYRGIKIDPSDYKWFAAIRAQGQFRCGGALIGSRYVVTANHCVADASTTTVQVGYLCNKRGNCSRKNDDVGVLNLFRHRHQGSEKAGGDMALIELNRPVDFDVSPAIPYLGKRIHPKQRSLKKKSKMTLVGGGLEGTNGEISDFVAEIDVRYLKPDLCKKLVTNQDIVTKTVICSTVLNPPNASPCRGDSGSPLIVPGKGKWKGRDFIMGIHAKGTSDCSNPTKRLSIHFRMSEAAELIQSEVCAGEHPEDWCAAVWENSNQPTISPTPNPSFAPSWVPSVTPTLFPTFSSPTPGPTLSPSTIPTSSPFSAEPAKLRGILLRTFDGSDWTLCVSFNSNGSRLVTGGADGTVTVWNPLVSDDALVTFTGHSLVNSVRWNPTDTLIASGSVDGRIKLWDVIQKRHQKDLTPSHNTDVHALAWHPKGDVLVSTSRDDTIRIWNVQSGSSLRSISAPSNLMGLMFRPDGSQLASSSGNNTFHLWDVENDYELFRTFMEPDIIWGLAYSPNGRQIATCSEDSGVRLWDLSSGNLRHVLTGHNNAVYSVAWSADGKFIVSGSQDGTLRVWDAERGGEALTVLRGHANSVFSVDWSPDGTRIASGSADNTTGIWRIVEDEP